MSLVANRQCEGYYRVTLDVGNYREKRRKALVELAKRIGGQVAKNRRRQVLEPMSPYERRIIHTAIQEVAGVTSWSMGNEPYRRVVIGTDDDSKIGQEVSISNRSRRDRDRDRGGRSGKSHGGRQRKERRDDNVTITRPVRQVREFVPRSNPLPTAEDITPPSRTASEKESTATLYGRIDL